MLDNSATDVGSKAVECFDATALLAAPFKVFLHDSVEQKVDENGETLEVIIPDPTSLVKAVAMLRVLHKDKLTHKDLKFIRSAIEMKSAELAKLLNITPEHMSRLETGEKVLQPQTEILIRMLTFIKSVVATKSKEYSVTQIMDDFDSIFEGIAPCKLSDAPELEFHLKLTECAGESKSTTSTGEKKIDMLWDNQTTRVA